ncbi:MAG: hypothetical protein DMF56_19300 [Acidobacteria bacterium]|nr:MAG: hypothetical protein DMF56_19300 [Acidobacteriota bacterium]
MIDDEEELPKRLAEEERQSPEEEERKRKEEQDRQFEKLYAYYPGIVSLLKQLGHPLDEARELAQDVFLRVYQSMSGYRGESKWAFLQKIARRLAVNRIRDQHTQKREGENVPEEALATRPSDPTQQPDALFEQEESAKRYYHAIAQLNEKDRTCILFLLAGFSYAEMGDILGIGKSAVKSRIKAARDRLKKLLGKDALGLDGGS